MSVTFGLDIGTTTIKALSLKKSGNTFAVESLGFSPSTVKGLTSEAPDDILVFSENLKQILANSKIKQKEVNLALPESHVYTKIIEMPELSEKELAAALKYEMEQYIPLPLEQVRTDWQLLSKADNQGRTSRILIVAAPAKLIEKYEGVIEDLGLNVIGIETEMLAIHRSLYPLFGNNAVNMIVHIGAATTNIAVIENSVMVMVFHVEKGGIAMSRGLSIDLGIDIAQAEAYKKAYGLSKDAFEGKVGASLAPIIESIISDIKKTMLLYKEKNPNQTITQVILSGGSAQLPGIDIYLTNQLGVQVVLGSALQAYGIRNVPNEVLADALSLNVVVGLALKELI